MRTASGTRTRRGAGVRSDNELGQLNAGRGVPGKRPRTVQRYGGAGAGAAMSAMPGAQSGEAGRAGPESGPGPATDQQNAWDGMFQWSDTAGAGSVVQAQAASAAAGAASDEVRLSVSWAGKFGADISARVIIEGTNDTNKHPAWETLESEDVADDDGAEGEPAQRLSTQLRVDRYKRYQITVMPTADSPDDRYRKVSRTVKVAADASSASVRLKLGINRTNRKNVDDVWEDKDIDPDKASKTVSAQLFGRSITVNELVLPRVERTNALFAALPETTQQEIRESIAILGGYNKRTTSKGTYSNHSVGCAVDLNYNMDTRQNFHFERDDDHHQSHLTWVQDVIRTDPAHGGFNIRRATGQAQLEGARAFNRRFPFYLAELLELEVPQVTWDGLASNPRDELAKLAQGIRDYGAGGIVDKVTVADLDKAIKNATNASTKAKLREVRKYWSYTRAWLRGAMVEDKVDRRQEKLVGMIPIHEALLQVFLDAGWNWGGDWRRSKDYMHFEDKEAMEAVKMTED